MRCLRSDSLAVWPVLVVALFGASIPLAAQAPPACPSCAEDIQDAAIVCKHCGRDLQAVQSRSIPMVEGPKAKQHTLRNVLLTVLAVLLGVIALAYFGEDHQRFLAFEKERDAWHRKCDVYVGKATSTPEARECQKELEALAAYAKKQGW